MDERQAREGRFRWFPDGVLLLLLAFCFVLLVRDVLPARRQLEILESEASRLTRDLERKRAEKARLAAWTVLINTLYNLDITKTRE